MCVRFSRLGLLVCVVVSFLVTMVVQAFSSELDECKRLASKYHAKLEYRLPDNSRADLVSSNYVYEVDWSHKWAEGVGQALYYSIWTGKKPGLILLVKNRAKELRYILRAKIVCQAVEIRLMIEEVE